MRHIYTKEQEAWIADHADNMTAEALKDAFNEHFGTTVTFHSMIQKRQRMGINKGLKNREYTHEEEDFLRNSRNDMPMKKLHKLFCERFSDIGYYALKCKCQRMGLTVDDKYKFSTELAEKSRKPVGTEHKRSGYTIVKVSDEVGESGSHKAERKNWKLKQIVEWEKYHGKLPPKHQVIFLNGDRTDYSEENLVAVPLKYMPMLNRNHWIEGDAELTKTALKYCELFYEVNK